MSSERGGRQEIPVGAIPDRRATPGRGRSRLTRSETGTSRTERVQRALEDAVRRPAPAGRLSAVVIIATIVAAG
jgi:hypothetical protein